MYIVRRPFKAGGVVYEYGTLVEDLDSIKLGKMRFNEGKLIQIDLDNVEEVSSWALFFLTKAGVDIMPEVYARNRVPDPLKKEEPTAEKPTGTLASEEESPVPLAPLVRC